MAKALLQLVALAAILCASVAREPPPRGNNPIRPHRDLQASSGKCGEFGGRQYTALLNADPGDFSGSAEAKYFTALLKNNASTPLNQTVCAEKTFGEILGQPVLLVTTGIGPMTAALCMYELLSCAEYLKEVVYVGTSGWSVQVGGVLNAGSCGSANPSPKVTHLGDLCVSPLAINWDCQLADWTQQCGNSPDVCTFPQSTYNPSATFLFGQCIFPTPSNGSLALADEILGAAQIAALNYPRRTAKVKEMESTYFAALTNGTGVVYDLGLEAPPTVYGYNVCSEVDGQFFYSGVPWEMSARNFTAILINQALNSTITQRDVIAVAAMEGIGINYAMYKYNGLLSTTRQVPFTFVRANSDKLHNPVRQQPDGTWRQVEGAQDLPTGYAYAVATSSNLVLTWLQRRCYAAQGVGNANCFFSVTL